MNKFLSFWLLGSLIRTVMMQRLSTKVVSFWMISNITYHDYLSKEKSLTIILTCEVEFLQKFIVTGFLNLLILEF